MKKYLILLLIIPLLLIGCAKKKPVVEYNNEARDKIIELLGKTENNRIVVKINKGKFEQYYLYEINNINFTLYNYTFYDKKSDYDEMVEKYKANVSYELQRDDEGLTTRILVQKGSKSDDAKDLKTAILNKYIDNKDYEIIY